MASWSIFNSLYNSANIYLILAAMIIQAALYLQFTTAKGLIILHQMQVMFFFNFSNGDLANSL